MQRSGPAVARAAGLVQEQQVSPTGEQEFIGLVKSYNARRGFGFVACAETAQIFGRDVYIAKAEAQLAYEEGMAPDQVAQLRTAVAEKLQQPIINEEDLIRFKARVSPEGHPQAEQIRRLYKFQGTVLQPPPQAEDEAAAPVGRIASDELAAAFGGQREVLLRRARCGQAALAAGDRVTFCVQVEEPLVCVDGGVWLREASLVALVPQQHQVQGTILGCFTLLLPRPPATSPQWSRGRQPVSVPRADLLLDCHAVRDRIIVSGLPGDIDEAELMRFFSKHGGEAAALAQSRSGIFASVTFPSVGEVVRFVARSLHTFADDKETRLARLLPRGGGRGRPARGGLPGLPPPTMMPGEQGCVLVGWSPVMLATCYRVEMRQAGSQSPWSAVDPSSGLLTSDAMATFGKDCTWCRVNGLHASGTWEARVTYAAACGCWSDASDCTQWCAAAAQPMMSTMAPMMPAARPMPMLPPGACGGCGCRPGIAGSPVWQRASGSPPPALPGAAPEPWPQAASAWSPQPQPKLLHAAPLSTPPPLPMPAMAAQGWRCLHGAPLAPPAVPEVRDADGLGFALVVQWPTVANATAYVVELRDCSTDRVERFVRNVPGEAVGAVVELRIGGLRPAGGAGRRYAAQVRSVSGCGCESEPSAVGMSAAIGGDQKQESQQQRPQPQPQQQPIVQVSLAAACGLSPAPAPPASFGLQGSPARGEEAKLGRQHLASPAPVGPLPSASPAPLPSLLRDPRRQPTLLGRGAATSGSPEPEKQTVPELEEDAEDEDCIILD